MNETWPAVDRRNPDRPDRRDSPARRTTYQRSSASRRLPELRRTASGVRGLAHEPDRPLVSLPAPAARSGPGRSTCSSAARAPAAGARDSQARHGHEQDCRCAHVYERFTIAEPAPSMHAVLLAHVGVESRLVLRANPVPSACRHATYDHQSFDRHGSPLSIHAPGLDRHRGHGRLDVRAPDGQELSGCRLQPDQGPRRSRSCDRGADWADVPAAVAERSDIVFTMVGFPSDVRGVYFGDTGLLGASRPGDDPRRHDDDRAEPGARDLRRGQGQRRRDDRRARLGRRHRGAQRGAVDHGRRRHGCRRARHAAAADHGQERRAPGRGRDGPGHEDVQPDRPRRRDDWRLRESAVLATRPASTWRRC